MLELGLTVNGSDWILRIVVTFYLNQQMIKGGGEK